jgi:hypothetical protein
LDTAASAVVAGPAVDETVDETAGPAVDETVDVPDGVLGERIDVTWTTSSRPRCLHGRLFGARPTAVRPL